MLIIGNPLRNYSTYFNIQKVVVTAFRVSYCVPDFNLIIIIIIIIIIKLQQIGQI